VLIKDDKWVFRGSPSASSSTLAASELFMCFAWTSTPSTTSSSRTGMLSRGAGRREHRPSSSSKPGAPRQKSTCWVPYVVILLYYCVITVFLLWSQCIAVILLCYSCDSAMILLYCCGIVVLGLCFCCDSILLLYYFCVITVILLQVMKEETSSICLEGPTTSRGVGSPRRDWTGALCLQWVWRRFLVAISSVRVFH
jgi:hypothetical protein